MRYVEAHDLELFTINTGKFYKLHCDMAGRDLSEWVAHVTCRAVPRYCQEVEPVRASCAVCIEVARNLKAYYEQHVAETLALKAADNDN